MTPAEFENRMSRALGGRGWQSALAKAIDIQPSTIRRWLAAETPVPGYAEAICEFLEQTPAAFRSDRWFR